MRKNTLEFLASPQQVYPALRVRRLQVLLELAGSAGEEITVYHMYSVNSVNVLPKRSFSFERGKEKRIGQSDVVV